MILFEKMSIFQALSNTNHINNNIPHSSRQRIYSINPGTAEMNPYVADKVFVIHFKQ